MSWINSVRNDIASLHSSKKEWRKFGLTVGGVFIVISTLASWQQWWSSDVRAWIISGGILLILFGLLLPKALNGFHRLWMSIAIILGSIVSRILLVMIFYCILTPVALIARWTGKKFLHEVNGRTGRTYWVVREKQHKIDYERMS